MTIIDDRKERLIKGAQVVAMFVILAAIVYFAVVK